MYKITRLSLLLISILAFLFVFNPILAQAQCTSKTAPCVKTANFTFIHHPNTSADPDPPDRLRISGYLDPGNSNTSMLAINLIRIHGVTFTIALNKPAGMPPLGMQNIINDMVGTGLTPEDQFEGASDKNIRLNAKGPNPANPDVEYDLKFQSRPYDPKLPGRANSSVYFSFDIDNAFFLNAVKAFYAAGIGIACPTSTPYIDYLREIPNFPANQFIISIDPLDLGGSIPTFMQAVNVGLNTFTCLGGGSVDKQVLEFE